MPKTPGRRLLLLASAFFAAGCSRFFRSEPSDPAASPQRKDPPDWFMVECWLAPEDVVPRRSGKAGGSMDGTLTLATGRFDWRVTYARLSGPATVAGFYGPAAKGSNGPLAIQLPAQSQAVQHSTDADAGYELTGSTLLTPARMADLMAGLWYVSVSTRAWPAGEVRGQMLRKTSGVHGG